MVLDGYSRRVVGWAMGASEEEELVTRALRMALARRRPQSPCFPLLHHSDRGSEDTSLGYQECLKQEGIEVSMSRTGDGYDHAAMESFFATLKKACVHRHHFQNRRQARQVVFEYLECFYNAVRLHSTLGDTSPRAFEEAADHQMRSPTLSSPSFRAMSKKRFKDLMTDLSGCTISPFLTEGHRP
ncbi:MAG: DDE-type integrase/transposase/recombinase [Ktedonobacteraceae bacterium]|nr:DDE-type integrase/transposase/recombinase [Ktedonobacteraceae bacterium]